MKGKKAQISHVVFPKLIDLAFQPKKKKGNFNTFWTYKMTCLRYKFVIHMNIWFNPIQFWLLFISMNGDISYVSWKFKNMNNVAWW
jgi:hypothetical protein